MFGYTYIYIYLCSQHMQVCVPSVNHTRSRVFCYQSKILLLKRPNIYIHKEVFLISIAPVINMCAHI